MSLPALSFDLIFPSMGIFGSWALTRCLCLFSLISPLWFRVSSLAYFPQTLHIRKTLVSANVVGSLLLSSLHDDKLIATPRLFNKHVCDLSIAS